MFPHVGGNEVLASVQDIVSVPFEESIVDFEDFQRSHFLKAASGPKHTGNIPITKVCMK